MVTVTETAPASTIYAATTAMNAALAGMETPAADAAAAPALPSDSSDTDEEPTVWKKKLREGKKSSPSGSKRRKGK